MAQTMRIGHRQTKEPLFIWACPLFIFQRLLPCIQFEFINAACLDLKLGQCGFAACPNIDVLLLHKKCFKYVKSPMQTYLYQKLLALFID
jgi:hypothetical protein